MALFTRNYFFMLSMGGKHSYSKDEPKVFMTFFVKIITHFGVLLTSKHFCKDSDVLMVCVLWTMSFATI